MNEEKFRGKVKFFNSNRYFGFIEREGEEKELEEGDEVEFEAEESEKGMNAVKVRRVTEEPEEVEEE